LLNYIIRRVLYAIPILIGVNLITFSGKNVSDCWHGDTSELKPFARDNEMTV